MWPGTYTPPGLLGLGCPSWLVDHGMRGERATGKDGLSLPGHMGPNWDLPARCLGILVLALSTPAPQPVWKHRYL